VAVAKFRTATFRGACCVCGRALRRENSRAGFACAGLLATLDLSWVIFFGLLLHGVIIGPPGDSLAIRLIELVPVLAFLTFHSLLLAWVIRDDLYPRWKAERTLF
jgi:hypothetical protein